MDDFHYSTPDDELQTSHMAQLMDTNMDVGSSWGTESAGLEMDHSSEQIKLPSIRKNINLNSAADRTLVPTEVELGTDSVFNEANSSASEIDLDATESNYSTVTNKKNAKKEQM